MLWELEALRERMKISNLTMKGKEIKCFDGTSTMIAEKGNRKRKKEKEKSRPLLG